MAGDADAVHDLVALGDAADGEDREVEQEDRPPQPAGLADELEQVLVQGPLRHGGAARGRGVLEGLGGAHGDVGHVVSISRWNFLR